MRVPLKEHAVYNLAELIRELEEGGRSEHDELSVVLELGTLKDL